MNLRLASATGVVAALVSGVSLFVVYRFGFQLLDATVVGTWVMIQTLFVLARLPETSIGITLTRMVALARADGKFSSPWPYVAAGMILNVLPVFMIGVLIAYPVWWAMQNVFDAAVSPSGTWMLIYLSLGTAVLNASAVVLLSVVEGCQQITKRQMATIASNSVFAIGAYPLLVALGVMGFGLLYLTAAAVLLFIGLVLAMRLDSIGAQRTTVRQVMVSLWRENTTVSLMALIRLCFEPWTKFLVGLTGGLATAAFLDLALRLTAQVRIAVQAGTQPLLSVGARDENVDSRAFHDSFSTAQRLTFWFNTVSLAAQIAAAAFISYLGFGEVNEEFVVFYCILAVGSSINSMGVVGYYYDISGGNVRRVFFNQFKMMILNIIVGGLGALVFGAIGAVLGYAFSFIYGGVALAAAWMTVGRDRWVDVVKRERVALLSGLVGSLSTFVILSSADGIPALYLAMGAAGVAALLFTLNAFVQRHLLYTSLRTPGGA